MICSHCNASFPCSLVIDGKRRILNRRKYCLTCSPFGSHRTRPIGSPDARIPSCRKHEVLSCQECGREYDRAVKRGHSRTHCNSCVVNKRRTKVKQKLIDLKGGKCQVCGYSRCADALEFHHRDPKEKDFAVNSNRAALRFDKLVAEIEKCDLLCSTCHREEHAKINAKARTDRLAAARERAITLGR